MNRSNHIHSGGFQSISGSRPRGSGCLRPAWESDGGTGEGGGDQFSEEAFWGKQQMAFNWKLMKMHESLWLVFEYSPVAGEEYTSLAL